MTPEIQPSELNNWSLLYHMPFLYNINSIQICSRAWDEAVVKP